MQVTNATRTLTILMIAIAAIAMQRDAISQQTESAPATKPKLAQLLDRAPSPANAIAYVHFPSLTKLIADANMTTRLAQNVDDVWLISDLDLALLKPRWEAGYAMLDRDLQPASIADLVGGYVDEVAGRSVVWSPDQTYFVPLAESRMGFLRPADRALLSDWIDPAINVNETAYLMQRASQPEQYLSLMVAAELKDAFSPVPLAKRLESFDSLKAQPPETVARILASVEGVSIIVGRDSLAQCILKVDFTKSPQSLLPIASELLAEILRRYGTAAPEVLTWKATVQDNTMAFQGPITEGSLEGILNIFSVRGQAERVAAGTSGSMKLEKSDDQKVAYTSKNYFDEVTGIVENTRKHQSQTTGARAKWNDQQARKIDQMGTLNVDPIVVDYAANVAQLLRGNALTIRQGNMAAGATKAQQGLSNDGYYSGYYGYNSTGDYQRVTDVQTATAAYRDYASVLAEIDRMTASLRREMTDKYKIQF
jgi:hypothetical protein